MQFHLDAIKVASDRWVGFAHPDFELNWSKAFTNGLGNVFGEGFYKFEALLGDHMLDQCIDFGIVQGLGEVVAIAGCRQVAE